MAIGTYQLPSPRAIDALPAEIGMAEKAGVSNPLAMLSQYQGLREAQTAGYLNDVQQAHEFAVQQMQRQMADEQQKNAISLIKEPGGAAFLASGSPLGMSLGGSPGAMTNLAQASDTAQGAKNWQAAATGLNQASQGGYQLAPGAPLPPGVPAGMNLTNLGPAIVQGDKVKAAAEVQSAGIKAAGGGQPSASIVVRDANGNLVTLHVPKADPGKVGAVETQWGVPKIDQQPVSQPPPPRSPISGSSLAPNPAAALPPAPQDTDGSILGTVPTAAAAGNAASQPPPAAKTTSAPPQSNATAGTAALQDRVNANLGKMPPAVQADIRAAAAKNNNQPVVGIDTDGKPFARGASGAMYKDPK